MILKNGESYYKIIDAHTTRSSKHIWPFHNIMHKTIKDNLK